MNDTTYRPPETDQVDTPTLTPPPELIPPELPPEPIPQPSPEPQPEPIPRRHQRAQVAVAAPSERGAVVVILALVAVLTVVALLMGLRWQSWTSAITFPFPGVTTDYPVPPMTAPTDTPQLRRADTGDGTVLTLLDRTEGTGLTLQDIYRRVNPSIVSIQAAQRGGYSEGTGVLLSADGYLITNEHVIHGAQRADVTLADGRTLEALLVGGDQRTDLAVLKIDAQGLTPAQFGHSDQMVVGDQVVAIGNPLGSRLAGGSTMTDGILSAVNRDMDVNGTPMTLLQTTAALNSGNSGGALVNDQGQVIGITNMKLVDRGFSAPIEGLGFAIPTTVAKTVVDALIAEGHVTGRPMLGVTVRPATPDELQRAGVGHGLYVSLVTPGSDAQAKGIRVGDLILSADGVDLYVNDDLLAVKSAKQAGDTLDFVLLREGKPLEVRVTLVEQYELDGG